MTPVTKAALAALNAAMLEDPDGLAEACRGSIGADEARAEFAKILTRALLDDVETSLRAMGYADAIEEIIKRVKNIATAYEDTGEPKLAASYAKFGVKLFETYEKKHAVVVAATEKLKRVSTRDVN